MKRILTFLKKKTLPIYIIMLGVLFCVFVAPIIVDEGVDAYWSYRARQYIRHMDPFILTFLQLTCAVGLQMTPGSDKLNEQEVWKKINECVFNTVKEGLHHPKQQPFQSN